MMVSLKPARTGFFLGLAALTILLSACRPEPAEPQTFDGQRAFAEVEKLIALGPRDSGTPGAKRAAEHLAARLKAHGVEAEIDSFEDFTPRGIKTFYNVTGRISGLSDQWIILGSHFDTKSGIENFQGANDSGSSTGVLLELARILSGTVPETGIIFAFFDGEECMKDYSMTDGLHGSKYMAGKLVKSGEHKKVQAMILLDMIGDPDLTFTLPVNTSKPLAQAFIKAAHATGNRDRVTLLNTMILDDHTPFLAADIPAIDLIDFRFGSAPGLHDYWHTDQDNLEHISADSLQITGDIVLEMLKNLAPSNPGK